MIALCFNAMAVYGYMPRVLGFERCGRDGDCDYVAYGLVRQDGSVVTAEAGTLPPVVTWWPDLDTVCEQLDVTADPDPARTLRRQGDDVGATGPGMPPGSGGAPPAEEVGDAAGAAGSGDPNCSLAPQPLPGQMTGDRPPSCALPGTDPARPPEGPAAGSERDFPTVGGQSGSLRLCSSMRWASVGTTGEPASTQGARPGALGPGPALDQGLFEAVEGGRGRWIPSS